jgi:hypothetical protein
VVEGELSHGLPLPGPTGNNLFQHPGCGPTVAPLIRGALVILYSSDAEADRVFLRDLIRLPGGGRVGLYEARHPTALDL